MTVETTTFGSILWTLSAGAVTAVQVTVGALAIALVLGLGLALARTFIRNRAVRWLIAGFSEWMRNVPALVHLFVIYFGLASIGVRLSPLVAAWIGLGLIGAAVLCEVFSAGLRALHAGQREAALAAGLTPAQALKDVLLPQVLRVTLPSLANHTSQTIKDTSIASAIAVPEIMFYARNLVTSTFETALTYLGALLMYAVLVLPLSWAFVRLERRWGAAR